MNDPTVSDVEAIVSKEQSHSPAPAGADAGIIAVAVPSATATPPPPARRVMPSALSPTRPPYVPQFTAATQMILKRMKGESSSLSSALASASTSAAARSSIKPAEYEKARESIVMSMNVSSSLQMPGQSMSVGTEGQALSAPSRALKESAIRRVTAGLPMKAVLNKPSVGKKPLKRPRALGSSSRAGTKRKRGRGNDDGSSLSSVSDAEDEGGNSDKVAAPPTTTKSGRQVLKPTAYNPAAMDTAKKRLNYGKRTQEQALCKLCTRMSSPSNNQMVFCDGCNDGWHQRCHDPWIDDSVIKNVNQNWFCSACQAKRVPLMVKKKPSSEGLVRGSWSGRPIGQKRAYLSNLSHTELLNLLMVSVELYPDLPIFPVDDASPRQSTMPKSFFAGSSTDGLFSRAEANPNGPINFVRRVQSNGGKSSPKGKSPQKNGKGPSQSKDGDQDADDREDSPFAPPWPKPGKGLYSMLPSELDDDRHLVDGNDYEAFSVIVYDERGRKIEENGIRSMP